MRRVRFVQASFKTNKSPPPRSWFVSRALLFLFARVSDGAGLFVVAVEFPGRGLKVKC